MCRLRPTLRLALLFVLALSFRVAGAEGKRAAPPKGKALRTLVERYLDADVAERGRMREQMDRTYAPLDAKDVDPLRKHLLEAAAKMGRTLPRKSGTQYWFGKDQPHQGKYILRGKSGEALFLGLHGGGEGQGSADSMAAGMGGGGWRWIFPEVLEKTEHGWTDGGTEAWVLELIRAAKRNKKVDPDRIYITGHSMGGYGSWTIGAHHADLFAGIAPYAGAPSPVADLGKPDTIAAIEDGILANVANVRLHVYQSGDDKNVPPEANDFAMKRLKEVWKKDFPDLFDHRYDRVEGRGHAPPEEGYLPSQKWVAEAPRNARPAHLLWQPVLPWKRQWYWLYWSRPELGAVLEVRVGKDNVVDITTHKGSGDYTGLRLLLGPPLFDLAKEVVVRVDGKEVVRKRAERRMSTLCLSLPDHDGPRMFAAYVEVE